MKQIEDLTGRRFGRLVVLEYVGNGKRLCQCDCGETVEVEGSALKTGRIASCGCSRRKDISGQRFDKLTAIRYVTTRKAASGNHSGTMWECLCDCGNTVLRPYGALVGGGCNALWVLPSEN